MYSRVKKCLKKILDDYYDQKSRNESDRAAINKRLETNEKHEPLYTRYLLKSTSTIHSAAYQVKVLWTPTKDIFIELTRTIWQEDFERFIYWDIEGLLQWVPIEDTPIGLSWHTPSTLNRTV